MNKSLYKISFQVILATNKLNEMNQRTKRNKIDDTAGSIKQGVDDAEEMARNAKNSAGQLTKNNDNIYQVDSLPFVIIRQI